MIKAVLDRVFVRVERNEKTSGGIILVEDTSDNIGIVETAGPEVTSVKPGDKVLFHKFDDLPSSDPAVVVVRESSILGVFEE